MSAPIIWIIFPFACAVVLWFLQDDQRLSVLLGAGCCIVLAFFALVLPIGGAISFGSFSIAILPTLNILGRQLVIESGDRYIVVLIYAMSAFWFLGTLSAKAHRLFISSSLGIIALLVAALSVSPFLYAALLIEMAVLLSIPMMLQPGKPMGAGVLRYLIFQTLGMPIILIAGWVLDVLSTNPTSQTLMTLAAAFLGLGLAFWLAVFPFYSWVPLLSGDTHPYVAGFMLWALPTSVLLLILDFLDGFTWLRQEALLYVALQIVGVVMVASGGIWAAFQRKLTRLFGYAVIIETGFSLLALSQFPTLGLDNYAMILFPRLVALAVWSLSMSILSQQGVALDLDGIQQLFYRAPVAATALCVSIFSVAGFPLLAGFPLRLSIVQQLAQNSLLSAIWALVGTFGFLFASFRILVSTVAGGREAERIPEKPLAIFFLVVGTLIMIGVGIWPHLFLSGLPAILQPFPGLL
ncbi:MAG TPA: proton-conducting transporter membrane subunit [Longilinea sp.]|nr:proton-conducting transporter membrane subunit [Longilinea sp.]